MIYGWLTDWLTDPTVQGLTNLLNDLSLVDWLILLGNAFYSLKYYVTGTAVRELTNTLTDLQNVALAD